MEALKRQISYNDEAKYKTLPPSWMQQYREQCEAKTRERCEAAKELKRMREMNEDDLVWVTEEERARRAVVLANSLELLKRKGESMPYSYDGLQKEEVQELLPKSFSNSEYYLLPNNDHVETMVIGRGAKALEEVYNVTIGRHGYGEIAFDAPVNLEKLNVEEEIEIRRGHLLIKNINRLAGIPATVTLHKARHKGDLSEI